MQRCLLRDHDHQTSASTRVAVLGVPGAVSVFEAMSYTKVETTRAEPSSMIPQTFVPLVEGVPGPVPSLGLRQRRQQNDSHTRSNQDVLLHVASDK